MNGLLAGFASERDLRQALVRLHSEEIETIETYTPAPPEEELPLPPARTAEPTSRRSRIPLAMFVAGMAGFVGFFALMAYANVFDYPLDIGGRPRFAWPTFVPIAFELGVLCAMVTGFLGFFMACRLPRLYDPIDECDGFRRASQDLWFVAIRSSDAGGAARVRAVVDELGAASIDEFRG